MPRSLPEIKLRLYLTSLVHGRKLAIECDDLSDLTLGANLGNDGLTMAECCFVPSGRIAAVKDNTTQIDKDLASRWNDILWPQNFLPENAGIFVHNEVLINAHFKMVWSSLIEGPKWPTWFVLTKVFEIEGNADCLTADARFRWGSSAFQVDGHVVEFNAPFNLRFTGAVPGYAPTFLHVWNLYEKDGACLAVYEEVGIGDRAADLGRSDNGSLHRNHDLMLAGLKWISESRNK